MVCGWSRCAYIPLYITSLHVILRFHSSLVVFFGCVSFHFTPPFRKTCRVMHIGRVVLYIFYFLTLGLEWKHVGRSFLCYPP